MQPLERTCGCFPPTQPGAWQRFKDLLQSRDLIVAVVLIAMAAVVKGSVEEMLPFHADHRWGYKPWDIGLLFCNIAVAYIFAAYIVGQWMWDWLGEFQVVFSAYWLLMLGIVAWMCFAVISYFNDANMLIASLWAYGICLGMTHTPAALLLAKAIDHEEGAGREAVNGIWNTMWEAGGSIGFLLGGLLGEHYHEQMALLTGYSVCCVVAALCMVTVASWPEDGIDCSCTAKDKSTEKLDEKRIDYGSIASSA